MPTLPKDDPKRAQLAEMSDKFKKDFPDVPEMSCEELYQKLQQDDDAFIVVDARTPDEQQVSMLPGSKVMTKQVFEANKDEHRNERVVCYCTVGLRSLRYAAQLRKEGFDACSLRGSIIGWTQESYPLVQPDGSDTRKVHTYGAKWSLQGDGYEAVAFQAPIVRGVMDAVGEQLSKLMPRSQ